ncbi:hypothetical protein AB0N65_11900 [Paenarthrobacter sp. NPDC089322]|uniref:hypothetical protein n=1 Tax=Paenarthrobacter sp. NPDC089322 TaxID=3155065 RepID=UPI0034143067
MNGATSSTNEKIELNNRELALYVREVVYQARIMRKAVEEYNVGLHQGETTTVLVAAQNAINAAMAINRLFWVTFPNRSGAPDDATLQKRAFSLARAKQLRKIMGNINQETSPLADRKVRNAFEHFEQYLDDFLFDQRSGDDQNGFIGDVIVAPRDGILVSGKPPIHLRHVHPDVHEVGVLTVKTDLLALAAEVVRVDCLAKEWLRINDEPQGI